jgi:hypothetical protein
MFGAHLNTIAVLVANEHEVDDVGHVKETQ